MSTTTMWSVSYDDYDVRTATVAVFDTENAAKTYAESRDDWYVSYVVRNPGYGPKTKGRRVYIVWNGHGDLRVSVQTMESSEWLGPCGVELCPRISRSGQIVLEQHDHVSIEGTDADSVAALVSHFVTRFREAGAPEPTYEGIHFCEPGTVIYTTERARQVAEGGHI